MNKRFWKFFVVVATLFVAVALYIFNVSQVSAHEGREIGDFEINFGWQVEPAFAGVYNGPEIRITDTTTDEPVEGAEETLSLTVNFGGESKELDLQAAWNEPGNYRAYLIPTRPGDYEFEITGTISVTTALTETEVSEIFSSADGDFSTIEPASDLLFPDTKADTINLQKRIETLEEEIEALKEEMAELSTAH